MAHLIYFRTARFDVSKETPNPINPIAGESVLNWLREEIEKSNYESSEPDIEDWGWYICVNNGDATYLVGASADVEDSAQEVDWIIQVHKQRSLKDKILGRNKLTSDDSLFSLIESIVRTDGSIEAVEVDRNA